MSSPVTPTTRVRPTRPTRRRKKGRRIGILVFIAVWIGLGIYSSTQKSHHHGPLADDRSDLIVAPAAVTVPAGGRGVVPLRLDNAGPDDLDHTVTFTFTTTAGLTMTGPGSIDEDGRVPLEPTDECSVNPGGTGMSCDVFMDIEQGRHDIWRIPVRVASDVAPGTALQLGTTAVSKYSSLYTDPNNANNTQISYPVQVSKRSSGPPVIPSHPARPSPPHPTSPAGSPSRPAPTHPSSGRPTVPSSTATTPAQPTPTSTQSHTSVGKRVRNAARDAVVPVTIVAAAVVGLALLIVISLVFVARRQRRRPLNYIPPRRDKAP